MIKTALEEMPEWQLGYIAAMIDGEGSITISKRQEGRFTVSVDVRMTHELTVKTLYDITECGHLYLQPIRGIGTKPQWKWNVSSPAEIKQLLKPLLPYMLTKRKQATLMVDYCERNLLNLSTDEKDETMREEMCRLNQES